MEKFSESAQIVLDFKTLLQVAQAKENSDLFDTAVWQSLTEFAQLLETVNTAPEIADKILDWCEQHPQINEVFKNTDWAKCRCDMDDESGTDTLPLKRDNPPVDIVENKYEIQQIIKANQPTPPSNNPPA